MHNPHTILVLLDIPGDFAARAKYVCEFLSDAWGLRMETTQDLSKCTAAYLVYSASPEAMRSDSVDAHLKVELFEHRRILV